VLLAIVYAGAMVVILSLFRNCPKSDD